MKSLDALLSPRRIAVVGASANPKSIGGQPVSILREAGFEGVVYPVNPRYTELNGERCYPDLASLPERCDMAVVAVNADLVGGVIEQCAAAGIPFATVFSSGFREVAHRPPAHLCPLLVAGAAGGTLAAPMIEGGVAHAMVPTDSYGFDIAGAVT